MPDLEESFLAQLVAENLPLPERQYKAVPPRRFSWDFAWPEHKLLVEIQGGTWRSLPSHSSPKGIRRDAVKLNLGQLSGWRQLNFTSDMVRKGQAIALLKGVLNGEIESSNIDLSFSKSPPKRTRRKNGGRKVGNL